VDGTLFFTANDGVNGDELWKTDGTEEGTQLVKDISTGSVSTSFYKFASFDGKIFFTASANGAQSIWYSDGTANGTHEVLDPDISGVRMIDIYAAGKYLFFPGYSSKLGLELYAGKADEETRQFVISKTTDIIDETAKPFKAVVYPNPAISNTTLQITGDIKNDLSISISDMSGKKLWQVDRSISSKVRFVNLPIEKYVPGIYIVTVTSGAESKTIKLIKQ
jgi:ELWxxDGT repeat protein